MTALQAGADAASSADASRTVRMTSEAVLFVTVTWSVVDVT